jgi:hypothetical protein
LSGDELRGGNLAEFRHGIEELTPSQAHFPHRGCDGHPLEIRVRERGSGQRRHDFATGNRSSHAIELIRPNYYDGISAVERNTLRAALLGLAHYFAQVRLGILQAPAVARSRVARLGRPFHFHLDSFSGHGDWNVI